MDFCSSLACNVPRVGAHRTEKEDSWTQKFHAWFSPEWQHQPSDKYEDIHVHNAEASLLNVWRMR